MTENAAKLRYSITAPTVGQVDALADNDDPVATGLALPGAGFAWWPVVVALIVSSAARCGSDAMRS
jgi:hypothetical protein